MPPDSPRKPPPRRSSDSSAARSCHATVMSLDGVGRQIAIQLASLGVSRLQLVDHRTVSRTRQVAEGYDAVDVGRMKVHAAAQACHEVNPSLEIQSRSSRSCRRLDIGDVVFCNADDEQTCRRLQQCDLQSVRLLVFWHVSEPLIEVSTFCDATAIGKCLGRFSSHKPESATRSSPVVSLHAASMAAGLAVDQFVRFVDGLNQPQAVFLDLATMQRKTRSAR